MLCVACCVLRAVCWGLYACCVLARLDATVCEHPGTHRQPLPMSRRCALGPPGSASCVGKVPNIQAHENVPLATSCRCAFGPPSSSLPPQGSADRLSDPHPPHTPPPGPLPRPHAAPPRHDRGLRSEQELVRLLRQRGRRRAPAQGACGVLSHERARLDHIYKPYLTSRAPAQGACGVLWTPLGGRGRLQGLI